MSQVFQLDALVTVLACLSTTHDEVPPIMKNSRDVWQVDNGTGGGCPVSALDGFSLRVQYLANEVNGIRSEMGLLQEQLSNLERDGPIVASRISIQDELADRHSSVAGVNHLPRNCWSQKHGNVLISPYANSESFYVYCDQKIRGGGWILIANRHDGSEDFNRNWEDYKIGFGELNSEFFIGLDKLHILTNSDNFELLIMMQNKNREQRFALYSEFSIDSEKKKYLLYVLGKFAGDAGDSLRYHAGKKFTTYDQDNDENAQNCARVHSGAWWYGRECVHSNLFGTFQGKFAHEIGNYKGILWKTFVDGPVGSLRNVRMLIRNKKPPSTP